jgi:cytochrome o ubiquinol oxidase operon protein cyoD
MSTETPSSRNHGTMTMYIIGFVLSLGFTLLAYFMVVNKTVTGNALLAAILGLAVLQMLVQIFFFLHLGRGPKPFYNIVLFFATAGVITLAIGGSLFIMTNLYRNMSPDLVTRKLAQGEGIAQVDGHQTGACQGVKKHYRVTIKNGRANPAIILAHRCDTLTFINQDGVVREIAFGPHPRHEAYGGELEEIVRKGYPKTVTLNEVGNFIFHDHLDPLVNGHFSVEP